MIKTQHLKEIHKIISSKIELVVPTIIIMTKIISYEIKFQEALPLDEKLTKVCKIPVEVFDTQIEANNRYNKLILLENHKPILYPMVQTVEQYLQKNSITDKNNDMDGTWTPLSIAMIAINKALKGELVYNEPTWHVRSKYE